jgi:hypothetical protein
LWELDVPYEGEFAGYRSLTRLAAHPRVRSMLANCEPWSPPPAGVNPMSLADVRPSGWLPDWILAVDGSFHQTQVENGYPGAEVCYLTIAAVMLDVFRMRSLDEQRPVDPKEFRRTQTSGSIDCVLPGCSVILKTEEDAVSSFRRALYEEMKQVTSVGGGETLLETYEALLTRSSKAGSRKQQCPYDDCDDGTGRPHDLDPRIGTRTCKCSKTRVWFSTDSTRIHEAFNPTGPSGEMFGEVMQVWERLYTINILRSMVSKGWASSFARVAVVMDGPLMIAGHPAWLSQAIKAELRELNAIIRRETGGQDLLLLGIEKSGSFVDHFERLDVDPAGGGARFSPGTALLPSNEYIRKNIVPGTKPYGKDTYFGRKFFYKTASGARIVGSLPVLSPASEDRDDVRPEVYPRLQDALSLIDSMVSTRYPNALTALVSAHAEAAIPLNIGTKVLERLAREVMKGSSRG